MAGPIDDDAPIYVISVAAELAGMHPQTLRQYDRLGIVTPQRARGRGRRYSRRDVESLREVQRLSQDEGINLAGIRRIIELERELDRARDELGRLRAVTTARVFAASASGEVSELPQGRRARRSGGALVIWRPTYRG
ncbi:heat shock protein transcriptional repressor HspR [Georgenia sp. H159]|uniref:heat shock protein transcriptional repressor HspR n=1 Tax=Georgenia sp. H159 TaxID=3076115 RepID=UPI002D783990|nr:MerR family transcriptional regulator [Georgenia sp. H159]